MLIAAFLLASIIFLSFYKFYWRRKKHKEIIKSREYQSALIFDQLYKDINGTEISIEARKNLKITDPKLIYGEITFRAFIEILKLIKPNSKDIFYDLGSGTGKAIIACWLNFNLKKIYGIEILTPLYNTSLNILKQAKTLAANNQHLNLKNLNNIEYINTDIQNTNLSNASIIFIAASCYSNEDWQQTQKIFKATKPGTKIITISKQLPSQQYNLLNQRMCEMSWGYACVFIYQKT